MYLFKLQNKFVWFWLSPFISSLKFSALSLKSPNPAYYAGFRLSSPSKKYIILVVFVSFWCVTVFWLFSIFVCLISSLLLQSGPSLSPLNPARGFDERNTARPYLVIAHHTPPRITCQSCHRSKSNSCFLGVSLSLQINLQLFLTARENLF